MARAGGACRDDARGRPTRAHIDRVRAHYRESRDVLIGSLKRHFGEVGFSGEGSGLHLSSGACRRRFLTRAWSRRWRARRRVGVYRLASERSRLARAPRCWTGAPLLLGYGAVTPKQIEQGVERFSGMHRRRDRRSFDRRHRVSGAPSRGRASHRSRRAQAPRASGPQFSPPTGSTRTAADRVQARRVHATRAAQFMAQVVKASTAIRSRGSARRPLTRADIEAGQRLSRTIACSRSRGPAAPIDPVEPQWAKKGLFADADARRGPRRR